MHQNDFTTSPPATGGDADLAAAVVTEAAFAMSVHGTDDDRLSSEHQSRTALEHPHPDVRVSGIAALARLRKFSVPDLQLSLSDPSSLVRRRGVEAAAEAIQRGVTTDDGADQPGDPTPFLAALLPALSDDASVTEAACFAVGEFGPGAPEITNRALPLLEAVATDHADPLCRESAVASLGALHRSRETVLAAMGDKATVRRRAVLALAPFDGPDVDAALGAALEDRDWQVRQAAEDQVAARQ